MILGLLTRFIPGRKTLYTAGAAFLIGISTATYTLNKFHEAEKADLLRDQLKTQTVAIRRAIDQAEEIRNLDHEVLSSLDNKERDVQVVKQIVTKEVIKYVEADVRCNPTVGAVGLLNLARASSYESLPEAAQVADEEGRAPSDLTQREEIEAHADCALRYADLLHRHNALIDWIDGSYEE